MQDIKKLIIDTDKTPKVIYINVINEKQPSVKETKEDENIDNMDSSHNVEDLRIEILEEMEMIMHLSIISSDWIEKRDMTLTTTNICYVNLTFKEIIKKCNKAIDLILDLQV